MSPDAIPVLTTIDKRGKNKLPFSGDPEIARRVSTIPYADEVHRLADVARALPKVVTIHDEFGQPPGDLAYTAIADWTDEQAGRAQVWLDNERSKAWWAAQGQAQREAVTS